MPGNGVFQRTFIADLYAATQGLSAQQLARKRIHVAVQGFIVSESRMSGVITLRIRDGSLPAEDMALSMWITSKAIGYSNIIEYPSLMGMVATVDGILGRPALRVSSSSPSLTLNCQKIDVTPV